MHTHMHTYKCDRHHTHCTQSSTTTTWLCLTEMCYPYTPMLISFHDSDTSLVTHPPRVPELAPKASEAWAFRRGLTEAKGWGQDIGSL